MKNIVYFFKNVQVKEMYSEFKFDPAAYIGYRPNSQIYKKLELCQKKYSCMNDFLLPL